MEILRDFLLINKQTMGKTMDSLMKNWIIIFTGIAYGIINVVLFTLILTIFQGILSIFAGIALAILSSALISNYLYLLYNIINYNKIKFQDFKDGFKYFLRKIYTIFFFAWIGSYALVLIQGIMGVSAFVLNIIITVSIVVLLNPLPESLYQKSLDPVDSIMYTIDFMKDNWLNWIIPNLVFDLGLYFLTGRLLTNIFTTHLSFNFNFSPRYMIIYLASQVLFSFMMIYRGHLYKLLSTSTRRKRMYMRKF